MAVRTEYIRNDGNLIDKTIEVLQAVLARDLTALDPKLTRKISTRNLMLDDPGAVDPADKPLFVAATAIIDHFLDLKTRTIVQ